MRGFRARPKPLGHDLVCEFNFLELNPRRSEDHDRLFVLSREGLGKAAIEEFQKRAESVNRFVIAALIQSDPVVTVLRRELRRLAPGVSITKQEVESELGDVLKRDVVEGDNAQRAKARVRRAAGKKLRDASSRSADGDTSVSG